MIAGILAAFEECRTDNDFFRVQIRAEHDLTPTEFAALRERKADMAPQAAAWIDKIASLGRYDAGEPPHAFRRRQLGEFVNLYGSGKGNPGDKRLIIGFCGLADQLMLPIPCILQYFPAAGCDVIVLRDPDREYYNKGIGRYASSFPELLRRLAVDAALDQYRKVFTFGTSVGGHVALRAGMLLEADRALSVSGTFPWHISRLSDPKAFKLPAFDVLCDCWKLSRTRLFCAYGGANKTDVEEADKLAAILPVRRMVFPRIASHNLILELARKGRLQAFFNRAFGLTEKRGRTARTVFGIPISRKMRPSKR